LTNIIKFFSNRPWLTANSISKPEPIIKTIPEWYRKADRFAVDPVTNEVWKGPDGGKVPTWKSCPAVFDVMGSGYALKTPCDLEFYLDEAGVIQVRIENPAYQDFCTKSNFKNIFSTYEFRLRLSGAICIFSFQETVFERHLQKSTKKIAPGKCTFTEI
jgi:hypothetical protein